jgi:methyl-accepting chemotaxis protein
MEETRATNIGERASIRRALARAILITTGIALALASAATVGLDMFRYRQSAEASVTALAHVVGTYSKPALDFDDSGAGAEALAALDRQKSIVAAALFDASGAPFASYHRPDSSARPPAEPGVRGIRYENGALHYCDIIESDGQRQGYVYLRMELAELESAVWQSAATIAGVMVIALLLASAAASRLREQIAQPLEALARCAGAMERGDLSIAAGVDRRDEIGTLANAFDRTRQGLRALVSHVRETALAIGDETRVLSDESAIMFEQARVQQSTVSEASSLIDRVGASAREVRDTVDGIAATATQTSSSVTELDATARRIDEHMDTLFETIDGAVSSISEMSAAARQIAQNADSVGTATRSTGSSVEVLRASVKSVEANAKQCEGLSAKVSDSAHQGSHVVGQVMNGMGRIQGNFQGLEAIVADLSARSEVIDEVVKVIEAVVAETNLLALNASIISSHAGEHGRAFAVVAQEVKNLANRTAGSTREISDAMEAVRSGIDDAVGAVAAGGELVEQGVAYSEEAGAALDEIRKSAEQSGEMVSEIVRATAEQSSDIDAVDGAMKSLGGGVNQITVGTHAQDKVASELLEGVEQMRQLAREVKVATSEQSRQSGHMSQAVEEVAHGVHAILQSAEDQHRDVGAIVESLGVFERNTTESARRAEAMRRCSEKLSDRAEQLEAGVGRFTV